MKTKHTPLPWQALKMGNTRAYYQIIGGDNAHIVDTTSSVKNDSSQANAEFIVKACNSHYDLLEALIDIRERLFGIDVNDLSTA